MWSLIHSAKGPKACVQHELPLEAHTHTRVKLNCTQPSRNVSNNGKGLVTCHDDSFLREVLCRKLRTLQQPPSTSSLKPAARCGSFLLAPTLAFTRHELPLEGVQCRGVNEPVAGDSCHVVSKSCGVVLQDLTVDEVPHVFKCQLAPVKLKGQFAERLCHWLS